MHSKSLITAALALTAATSLVVLSTRPSQADPAPVPSYQENLEARVKQLEAEVKALRAELKELKSQKVPILGDLTLRDFYFDDKAPGGAERKFFSGDGDLKVIPPRGDWGKVFKDMPQSLELETKNGKTIIKVIKPGEKQPRTYELPGDRSKLEKDFPNLKMLHDLDGAPFKMRMFGPNGDFRAFDRKDFEKHMKELQDKLSKEFGPEFSEKLKKEMEAARREADRQRKEAEKERESLPPLERDPQGSEPISI